ILPALLLRHHHDRLTFAGCRVAVGDGTDVRLRTGNREPGALQHIVGIGREILLVSAQIGAREIARGPFKGQQRTRAAWIRTLIRFGIGAIASPWRAVIVLAIDAVTIPSDPPERAQFEREYSGDVPLLTNAF